MASMPLLPHGIHPVGVLFNTADIMTELPIVYVRLQCENTADLGVPAENISLIQRVTDSSQICKQADFCIPNKMTSTKRMQPNTCSKCFEEFKSYSRLKRHLKTEHKMINKKKGNNVQSSVEANVEETTSKIRGVIQLTFFPKKIL